MPLDEQVARDVSDVEKSQRDVTASPEKTEQKHKGIDTRDINSPRRHRSKSCLELRLFCLRLCRAKKRCSERVLRKPTRRVLERIKARSKECGKRDDTAVAGVSTAPHRESISHRDAPKKSRRGRKQDEAAEVADKDTRAERKERRKREREARKRKALPEEEEEEEAPPVRRDRREREELVSRAADVRPVARDDDLVAEDLVPVRPPSIADLAKSCCYLCARNALAIAAASRPEQSDKWVQVSAHKFHAETPATLDKSCSPILLLVRTVQSSVKVRTRETGTLCPGIASAVPRAKKRKKFAVFRGLTRTKCPAGPRAVCETGKSTAARRDDNAEKREPRHERCCRERSA
ncbi:PREDICTED: stress response protein nst1-like [Vollenhovia emeryi]|uniref:stress response protein nst1-like n=1 Tax=Vollenhovia emeryi TaxID=411798 RepID=UPI0005F4353C|nr:PREDICTED: stress response protein nst1-like [Vollenhovia emeryi]